MEKRRGGGPKVTYYYKRAVKIFRRRRRRLWCRIIERGLVGGVRGLDCNISKILITCERPSCGKTARIIVFSHRVERSIKNESELKIIIKIIKKKKQYKNGAGPVNTIIIFHTGPAPPRYCLMIIIFVFISKPRSEVFAVRSACRPHHRRRGESSTEGINLSFVSRLVRYGEAYDIKKYY